MRRRTLGVISLSLLGLSACPSNDTAGTGTSFTGTDDVGTSGEYDSMLSCDALGGDVTATMTGSR